VPQLSVILGADQRAVAQLVEVVSVIFNGHLVITGFVVSPAQGELLATVTPKVQVALLFLVSVAV
jgi:phosphotransferase system IIA component